VWTWIEPVFGELNPQTIDILMMFDFREMIVTLVSETEAHRVIKIWRAFWRKMAAMDYCGTKVDPSLDFENNSPKGRKKFWLAHEVETLIATALQHGFDGAALAIATG
jgi:hypothetical protein